MILTRLVEREDQMKNVMLLPISLGLGLLAITFGVFSPKEELPLIFTYDQEDCTYSVNGYSPETNVVKKVNGEWIKIEATIQSMDCSLFTNSTGQYLTITKVYKEGVYEAKLGIFNDPKWIKSSMIFTNHGEPTEFAFTEKISNITLPNQISGGIDK